MEESLTARARILMEQNRYKEAEEMLRQALKENPYSAYTLSLIAEVNLHLDKVDEAESMVNSAIAVAPHLAHLYYLKARVYLQKEQRNEAEKYLQQAIAMDPQNAHFFAIYANLKLAKKDFEGALKMADKALELDPSNLLGLNMRSTALFKLGNKEDSFQTIEGALREDPDNAYTHANYGWKLLEKGDRKKAQEHFREALRRDPFSDFARAGMVEALKAGNPVYRLFLKYSFFMSNLTAKYQWAVIVGLYLSTKVLGSIAESNETLRIYLTPIVILLSLFAFSTWIITPLSNLFLRLNKYGKYLLTKQQQMSSNFVGISLLIFIAGLILRIVTANNGWAALAFFGFTMMVPLSVMFTKTKPKNLLLFYTMAMAVIGIAGIVSAFSTGKIFSMFAVIYILGFVALQWVANFIRIRN